MNLGEGSLILSYPNGWGCSKEAEFDVEFDILPDSTAKRTTIVTCKSLFNIGEEITSGLVDGVFKYDSGLKVAFKAIIQGKGRFVLQGGTTNDFETILNKISQWQVQFKEN